MPLFIHLESNPQVVWADCGGGRCYEGLVLRCESVRERGSLLLGGSLPLMWERAMPVKGLCSGADPFERGSLLQGGSLPLMWERAMPVKGLCSGAGPFERGSLLQGGSLPLMWELAAPAK